MKTISVDESKKLSALLAKVWQGSIILRGENEQ